MQKRYKAQKYYLPIGIIKNYNVFVNGKSFMINPPIPIQSNIKTALGNHYTTGCLLDYEYIKNHYRLIAVDLRQQKELDADPKAI